MEWSQLQKFKVAAQEENFSRAAELLDTSQPFLSQSIRRLEDELGYTLFDREGKRIFLNDSGRIFLQTVLQMEELMSNTQLRLEELNNISHPEVSLFVSSASTLLPELLLYLRKRNPKIRYKIRQWKGSNEIVEDDIQILPGPIGRMPALSFQEKNVSDKNTGDEILLIEEIHLALPQEHVLLQKEEITMNDLRLQEFIMLNDSWTLGKAIQQEFHRQLFTPKNIILVDNPNMMREFQKSRIGIAFVPSISWHYFAGNEIVLRPVADFSLSRMVHLRTKPRRYLTEEQKECIRGIREFFSEKRRQYHSQ